MALELLNIGMYTKSQAFTACYFGAKNVGPIYGLMHDAELCQPLRTIADYTHRAKPPGLVVRLCTLFAMMMLLSAILPVMVRPPACKAVSRIDSDIEKDCACNFSCRAQRALLLNVNMKGLVLFLKTSRLGLSNA
jgi:hypothetical protein